MAPPALPRHGAPRSAQYWHWSRSASWPARLVFCHIALWYWLRHHCEPTAGALILAGGDVVLAAILALLAARSTPGRIELEALAVRHRAVEGVTGTLAFSAIAMQLLRLAIRSVRRARR